MTLQFPVVDTVLFPGSRLIEGQCLKRQIKTGKSSHDKSGIPRSSGYTYMEDPTGNHFLGFQPFPELTMCFLARGNQVASMCTSTIIYTSECECECVSVCVCVCARVLSCVQFFGTLWTVACQAPLSM